MTKTVEVAMTPRPVTLEHRATIREAAKKMKSEDIGDVLVVRDGKLYGILTDRDIVVRCIAEAGEPTELRVGDICSTHLVTVRSTDSLQHAEELMRHRALKRLIVERDGVPVGVLSLGDLETARHPESVGSDVARAPANR
jgi:signal-transduction protein with cAMP-binding, CBS, and nucleotidyltransferase domain